MSEAFKLDVKKGQKHLKSLKKSPEIVLKAADLEKIQNSDSQDLKQTIIEKLKRKEKK